MRAYRRPGPLPDVLEEYVEEAGWLYESRCRSLRDAELSWQDLADFDARMQPHLDGLVLGGWASAELLRDVLSDDGADPRTGFVVANVLPRLTFVEPIRWLAEALAAEPEGLPAMVDGLQLCPSPALNPWLEELLDRQDPVLARVAATVVGYRRELGLAERVAALRDHPEPRVALAATWALAELGRRPEPRELARFLALEAPEDLERALELSLLADPAAGLERCRALCDAASSPALGSVLPRLAIAGALEDADRIAAAVERRPEVARQGLVALGLCGSLRHVERLLAPLEQVGDWELHGAAVDALRFLSDRDELPAFDPDEAEAEEISAYAAQWHQWWEETGSKLDASLKWRRGRPLSSQVLFEDLRRPGNPERHVSQLEARVRFACPCALQHDQLFSVQCAQLEQLRRWASDPDPRLVPGRAYLNCAPIA